MNKEKYQESLNDIIRNCKGFPCKNDSFYNMQELVDKSYIEYIGLEQQCKKQKEIIDKAIEYINHFSKESEVKIYGLPKCKVFIGDIEELLDILKEVSE